jgi:hypothetical protein
VRDHRVAARGSHSRKRLPSGESTVAGTMPTLSKPSAQALCLISSVRKSVASHLARKKALAVIGRQRFVGEHWWKKYPPLDLGFGKISFVNHFHFAPSRFQ